MKIEKALLDTHAVLTLRGEFNTEASQDLLEELEALNASGTSRAIVNLRLVKFINSTALGTMIRARKQLSATGGDMVVAKPSAICRELFEKTGIDRVVPTFNDEESAVAYLTGRGAAAEVAERELDADDADGPSVLFSFADDRSQLFKGRTHRGVGKIDHVDAAQIRFTWDAARHGVDTDETKRMFALGSPIRTKFRIKLIRKDFFLVDAAIADCEIDSQGTVNVTAKWSSIDGADKNDLTQYSSDMAYLKREVSDGS